MCTFEFITRKTCKRKIFLSHLTKFGRQEAILWGWQVQTRPKQMREIIGASLANTEVQQAITTNYIYKKLQNISLTVFNKWRQWKLRFIKNLGVFISMWLSHLMVQIWEIFFIGKDMPIDFLIFDIIDIIIVNIFLGISPMTFCLLTQKTWFLNWFFSIRSFPDLQPSIGQISKRIRMGWRWTKMQSPSIPDLPWTGTQMFRNTDGHVAGSFGWSPIGTMTPIWCFKQNQYRIKIYRQSKACVIILP